MNLVLVAGSGNTELAGAIATQLDVELTAAQVTRFPDSELSVRIEQELFGRDVVIVQPTSRPVDNNLIELLAFGDAARRGGCAGLTAVIPYFGYARGDTRRSASEPIMAKLVAHMIEGAGYQQLITVDLHAPAIEGFFQMPVRNLSTVKLFCDVLRRDRRRDTVVVSPDLGRAGMASAIADALGLSVAIVHKRRTGPRAVQTLRVIGDVANHPCLIVDDMISTGCTVVEATHALAHAGAIMPPDVVATHGVLVNETLASLHDMGINKLYLTDTIQPPASRTIRIEVVSVASLLAGAIRLVGGVTEVQHVATAVS